MKTYLTLLTILLTGMISSLSFAQNCGGDVRRGATSGFMDPNADGFITTSGGGFTDCAFGYVDEMLEFEDLRTGCSTCETPWTAIPKGSESTGDLWAGGASCGNTEIVLDDLNGTYSYYTIIDPNGICNDGDELLVFRVRVDASVNGSFSYSLLIDTDGLTGASDPDGVLCDTKVANAGFEFEIVANPANGGTVEVRNINGVVGQYGTDAAHSNGIPTASFPNTTHYSQAFACRSLCDAGGCDQASNAVYHTFAVTLRSINKSCGDDDFKFAGSTASSGNGTVSANTSVADLGGFDGEPRCPDPTIGCDCCTECQDNSSPYYCGAGGGLSICLMGCLSACIAEENSSATFPIDLIAFVGSRVDEGIELSWTVASEENNAYYEVQRSADGVNFIPIGQVEGSNTINYQKSYGLLDPQPLGGMNYYRLKYVDIFGMEEYSVVIAIDHQNNGSSIQVFPTRFKEELNVGVNLPKAGKWTVQLLNVYGQVAYAEVWDLQAGYTYRKINVAELQAGAYVFMMQNQMDPENIRVERVLK